MRFTPANLEIVFLSFEGPDQPYAQAGGLGVRVAQFTRALARRGFRTHLIFVGDPDLPGVEEREGGCLRLYRWSQWISAHHRAGVYEAEIAKVNDYQDSVPAFVTAEIVQPAVAAGRRVAVIAEEWQTADALSRLSDSLHFHGLRGHAVLLWNANNDVSFERVNWERLGYVTDFAAVSRYVKHQMWARGLNPIVVPNGIPTELLTPGRPEELAALRAALGADLWFLKIARMDPNKGWLAAVEAVHRLRERGHNARLVMKGGDYDRHGAEVFGHMSWRNLVPYDVWTDDRGVAGVAAALGAADRDAAILNLKFFVPDEVLPALYAAADGVLANSGYEPFGLVGLEAMAAGGIAYVGATGEDYAVPLKNCVALDDVADADEIVSFALMLADDRELAAAIRENARQSARWYTWDSIIPLFAAKLGILADRQGVSVG